MVSSTDIELLTRPAVVIGGNSGIGLAVVQAMVGRADAITVFDLAAEPSAELAALDSVNYRQADITDPSLLRNAFAATFESGPIGSVFVSAGITLPRTIVTVTDEEAHRCLMVNLMGSINVLKAALGFLAPDASIVLTASAAAYTGGGYVGGSIYGASKAGVIGLTRGAASELAAQGIRVNCVAPGATATPMVGSDTDRVERLASKSLLGRLATPAEIAAGVVFLWSSAASYMTGATLDINGGSHLG